MQYKLLQHCIENRVENLEKGSSEIMWERRSGPETIFETKTSSAYLQGQKRFQSLSRS